MSVSSSPPPDIAHLRAEIDALDDALLDLVVRRTALASAVASAKAAAGDAGSSFRPAREVQIIRRLVARAPSLPPRLVGALWRALIGANLAAQGGLRVVAAPGVEDVARLRFGAIVEPERASAEDALAAASAGAVAVLPWPGEPCGDWWLRLLEPSLAGVHVVAAAPILKLATADGAPRALLLAAAAPEPAGEDITLVAAPAGVTAPGGRIAAAQGWALWAAPGFLTPDDAALAGVDGARLLGAFAFA